MKRYKPDFIVPLTDWYRSRKKEYPWRSDPTPYHVWISEIMLQQTRIEAALPYYERLIGVLPTVKDLAECDEDKLMKLWQGLGYYSRARHLRQAAVLVMNEYGGVLPSSKEELLKLPGIGAYTAGAIASIAYGQPAAAVDGNVLRVLARLTADDTNVLEPALRKDVTKGLEAIYPTGPLSGELTEGLMELGEQVCLPAGKPLCGECPLAHLCRARAKGLTESLPVRQARTKRILAERTILLLRYKGRYALCKRPDTGLLAGLWELPGLEGSYNAEAIAKRYPGRVTPLGNARHLFSHITWQMTGYLVELSEQPDGFVWATAEEIAADYAIPSAFQAYTRFFL